MRLRMIALVLTVFALIPSAAHLFESPAKIALDESAYFAAQRLYSGWAYFGLPIVGAAAANFLLSHRERAADAASARWALASGVLVLLSLAVFFVFVLPANQATHNWTAPTEDWSSLRIRWEYGHAAGAILMFCAFLATCMATVKRWPTV